ncbi:hypothetical protein TASIC1_0004069900 [Trichoderma asperellum]|uniref:Uncharacterized protein n=1 Tax=Trichoderma asperellum TaxID=101201 RepID=A0A6V8QR75_TRIAP|nr:hypothetical protein TASIC1_0004069900 [Trichoderma asperellum]
MNNYDPSTGQVFREWTIQRRLNVSSDRGWSRRRPYPIFKPRGARGPRSLLDMAINVIADNIGDVSEELLGSLPIQLVWRIWRFLEARGVCFHAWKLFSTVLLREDDEKSLGLYRFRQHICRPKFITHLVLSGGCQFSSHELFCLTDMKNLGILELIQPADELGDVFPAVNDRVVRGWTESENPFPLLRILRIWGDQTVTQKSLRWVAKFPSLALYDVTGARDDWASPFDDAAEAGWEVTDVSGRQEGTLLRNLMLLVPDTHIIKTQDSIKSVEADLVTLCSDSQCAIKFVPDREAPPLLNYLTDTGKKYMPSWDPDAASRQAGACHGVAFEAWAFWLYSFLGQLSSDIDIASQGHSVDQQAVAGPFVLPSRPMACLFLGHSGRGGITSKPAYVSRGLFSTKRYTFTRPMDASRYTTDASQDQLQKEQEQEPEPKARSASITSIQSKSSRKMRKRKQLHDMLQSLSG